MSSIAGRTGARMLIWAGMIGAIAGWLLTDFGGYGFVVGGALGLTAGWVLRNMVRAAIAAATEPLQAQIDLLSARRGPDTIEAAPPSLPVPAAAPAPIAPAPSAPATSAPARSASPPVVRRYPPPAPAAANAAADRPDPAPDAGAARLTELEGIAATAIAAAKRWLFGGNTIVRVGLVILFIGLSFLASYVASAGLLPIEVRLSVVAAFGIALLAIGYRTRATRPGFGLALQGAGIAAIYLTLFAAATRYEAMPVAAAFVLMIVICALGCALALLQRSQALAVTAFLGGFAVPLLLGGGDGDVNGVFAYYTVLNLAILFIAQRRSWRGLNLVGFFATFGFATLWQASADLPADPTWAQAFLIISVLIYVATAILYARATPGRMGNIVDPTLLFGPALAGFGLETGLLRGTPFGSAFAALGFAALYLGVAGLTMRRRREGLRVMNEAMLAIGIGFVTLAVPLALGARWTSAVWALEGAGAFWVGRRQARWLPRLFGLALQSVAALIYLADLGPTVAALPIANAGFVGAMIVALAALATAWWLRETPPAGGSRPGEVYARYEAMLARPAFLFGFAFWWAAWAVEAARMLPPVLRDRPPVAVFAAGTQLLLGMLAYVVSAWGWQVVGRRARWPVATWPGFATLPALALGLLGTLAMGTHVLDSPGWAIWIVAIGLHLRLLYRNDRARPDGGGDAALLRATHVGGVWLAAAMLADCLWLAVDRGGLWRTAWATIVPQAGIVAVLAALTFWAGGAIRAPARARRWPLDGHAIDYGWHAAAPLALLVFAGALLTATSAGDADPLPYVPLLNPVDLMLGVSIAVLESWRRTVAPAGAGPGLLRGHGAVAALAGLGFVVVNSVWLRIAHHLLGVGWGSQALLASFVVQTGLAILWTVLALAAMTIAHRRGQRMVWLAGAALLGLTVAKLVLVDFTNAGGGARIVAFIGVGLLMLVIGYAAPLPPRHAGSGAAEPA